MGPLATYHRVNHIMMPSTENTDPRTATVALMHFAVAFAFLLLGVVALGWNTPRITSGQIVDPRVVGGLHLLTLGWVSTAIFGALQVFTSVALGSALLSRWLGVATLVVWAAGTLGLASGMTLGKPFIIGIGATLLGLGIVLFSINLIPGLWRASHGGMTRILLASALVSLWITWLIGAARAWEWAGTPVLTMPANYLPAHILVAVFGWAGATVVGVGLHLIPMFALAEDASSWALRWSVPLWVAIPFTVVAGAWGHPFFLTLGWGCAAAASTLWVIQVAIFLRARIRPDIGWGLGMATVATLMLFLAWPAYWLGAGAVFFVGLLIVGWLVLFTLGIFHRIIPFLVWYRCFSMPKRIMRPPRVRDMTNSRLEAFTAIAATSGILLWIIGVALGQGALAWLGVALLIVGSFAALGQLRWLVGGFRAK
ncbi:MAG: hypothetical protein ACNA8W_01180 [Bradymonadaceae bacterium]